MLLLLVSTPLGHLQGGHLQRNKFTTNAVEDVPIWIKNTLSSVNILLKI